MSLNSLELTSQITDGSRKPRVTMVSQNKSLKVSNPAVKRRQPKPCTRHSSLGDWASELHFLNESFFLISLFFLTGSLWTPWPKRRGKCHTLGAHAPKDLGVSMTIASL